jgi:hypothetical protein
MGRHCIIAELPNEALDLSSRSRDKIQSTSSAGLPPRLGTLPGWNLDGQAFKVTLLVTWITTSLNAAIRNGSPICHKNVQNQFQIIFRLIPLDFEVKILPLSSWFALSLNHVYWKAPG